MSGGEGGGVESGEWGVGSGGEVAAGPLGGISFWRTSLRGWVQASGLHHGGRRGITWSDDGYFGEAWGVGSGGGAAGGISFWRTSLRGWGQASGLHHGGEAGHGEWWEVAAGPLGGSRSGELGYGDGCKPAACTTGGGGASGGAVRGAFWGPFLGILQSRFLLLRLAKKTA